MSEIIIGIDASRANQEQRTGVGEYSFQIIQHLKEVLPAEVQVILYSKEPLIDELSELPENWRSEVLSWFPFLWTQVRLSYKMLIDPPDVLFIPSHVFPIIHPKKTIMTVHDIAAARFPEGYSFFERWYSLWSAKRALNDLYKVIVPTNFTKNELLKEFGKKCKNKVKVVKHGVSKQYSQCSSSKDVLKKYDISSPYIINIGRIEYKKNTKNLVDAFVRLKENSDLGYLKLLLVGNKGYGGEYIHKKIKNSDISEDIVYSGWVDEEDLPHLIFDAEAMTFVSLYEGFGIPLLEGFACKTPVIASNIESLKEVGGSAVVYVEPDDINDICNGVKKTLKNEKLKKNKIQAGEERLREFSWEKAAKRTMKILLS